MVYREYILANPPERFYLINADDSELEVSEAHYYAWGKEYILLTDKEYPFQLAAF
jgi:hypothetical protein